jgi:hypothetical protein
LHQEIKISDRPAWDHLCPGQFVVFFKDSRTDVVTDSAGRPADDFTSVAVFESVADAETYAGNMVALAPTLCAEIYDHLGRGGDPVRRIYDESIRRHFDPERRARRYAWTGGCLLVGFCLWSILAARLSSEHFLWFYIIGIKMLTLGTVLFVRGTSYFIGKRWQK